MTSSIASVGSSSNTAPARRRAREISRWLILGSQEGALHRIAPIDRALVPEMVVPCRERSAERAAGVAGGWLDPDVAEGAVAQQLAVRHAVERDTPGEAQVLHPILRRQAARHAQHDLFRHAWIDAATSM